MAGDRIEKARECLEIFIHSLPPMCLNSAVYDKANFNRALYYVGKMEANLGETNLISPLESILKNPNISLIFVITDGEVSNRNQTLNLVSQHCMNKRIFSIGVGYGEDADFVEGLARESNGLSDFVIDHKDLSVKVISQLEASFVPLLNIQDISIERDDSIEIVPHPLPRLSPGTTNTLLIRKSADVKTPNLHVNLETLFAYNEIQSIDKLISRTNDPNIGESLVNKLIDRSSGLLCKYTDFVGVSKGSYISYSPIELLIKAMNIREKNCNGPKRATEKIMDAKNTRKKIGSSIPEKIKKESNEAQVNRRKIIANSRKKKESSVKTIKEELSMKNIIKYQNFQGFWEDVSNLNS